MNSKNICLWSSPRNISTALMYSFAQRPDTLVIDEPLYAHYLVESGADHPGKDEIINSMESCGENVVNHIILKDYEKDVVFMKQMTHHLINIDEQFLEKVVNVFLIRDPRQLIASLSLVINNITMRDTGIQKQYELYERLNSGNIDSIVIDSGVILRNPEIALTKLCNNLHIPFYKEMLKWKAGGIKEDGVWAKYWYENVHNSTGFEKQQTSSRELPPGLNDLYEECLPFYEKMFKHSIKV
ncbi:MAG TPA: hypothetical protein PKD83_13285 [Ignavibacteria bacterium]|nr:hypothetical protein [Ignavibacteria bacterium]